MIRTRLHRAATTFQRTSAVLPSPHKHPECTRCVPYSSSAIPTVSASSTSNEHQHQQHWKQFLKDALSDPEPIDNDKLLHMRFANGNGIVRPSRPKPDARHGAVLVLLYPQVPIKSTTTTTTPTSTPILSSTPLQSARDQHVHQFVQSMFSPARLQLNHLQQLQQHQQLELHFPLTVRSQAMNKHRGEVSLPGGKQDPTDPSLIYTALRETNEELGVDPDELEILGELNKVYIPPSNFLIQPVVAWCPRPLAFDSGISHDEVAEVIRVNLTRELLDPQSIRIVEEDRHGMRMRTPYYDIQGHRVWGATCLVLSELVARIQREAAKSL